MRRCSTTVPCTSFAANGVWVEDADGRRYLDAYNNVPHVGHCHPHVVDAIARQAAELNLHTRYLHESVVDYAERLTAMFAEPLNTAMFTCSGTEANELALRMARFGTGNTGIIVSDFSYHGNSATLGIADHRVRRGRRVPVVCAEDHGARSPT